ncbi:MAG: ATP-binding cassette domain-containing protein [Pseudomonadota bacterium]
MLEARDVVVKYHQKTAVGGVSLLVDTGEFVALAGPNGSGKSSLIAALVGEVTPSGGAVFLNSHDIKAISAIRLAHMRAALEQSPSLSAPFTVRELASLAIPSSVTPSDTGQLTARALSVVGLSERGDDPVASLSGGQQRRAHLARALAQLEAGKMSGGGQALILDEPTAGLDFTHQINVLRAARKAADDGAAVLVALHDLSLAAAFADRIALMKEGRINAVGPPGDTLTEPRLSDIYETRLSVFHSPGGMLMVAPALGSQDIFHSSKGAYDVPRHEPLQNFQREGRRLRNRVAKPR